MTFRPSTAAPIFVIMLGSYMKHSPLPALLAILLLTGCDLLENPPAATPAGSGIGPAAAAPAVSPVANPPAVPAPAPVSEPVALENESLDEVALKVGDCLKEGAAILATVKDEASASAARPKLQPVLVRHTELMNHLRSLPKLSKPEFNAFTARVFRDPRLKEGLQAIGKENARLFQFAFGPPGELSNISSLSGMLSATNAMFSRLEDREM
jgi:hypothetical protein